VSKENFLASGPVGRGGSHFGGYVVGGAFPPRMSAERLRPEAESTLRGAAARGVKRDERMEQERDIVAGDVEVALVHVSDMGQGVEVLNLRSVGIVDDFSVFQE